MVDYVLVIPRVLRKIAESRGHRVYCFERLPCLAIPPSNSEAHRFANRYSWDVKLFDADPEEVLEAFEKASRVLVREGEKAGEVWVNENPYGPCYEETEVDEGVVYVNCGEFSYYVVEAGKTVVFIEID